MASFLAAGGADGEVKPFLEEYEIGGMYVCVDYVRGTMTALMVEKRTPCANHVGDLCTCVNGIVVIV